MMAYAMKRLLGFGFAASAVYGFNTSGLDTQYITKDSHPVPDGWINKGLAPGDHPITLHIGLRESMSLELEDLVYEVSNPDSPRYGQYLSKEQLDVFVRPTDETLNLTEGWLFTYGFEDLEYSSGKNQITLRTNISTAETLLNTTYYSYKHEEDSTIVLGTPEWSLPAYLLDCIDLVSPTNSHFFKSKSHPTSRKDNNTVYERPAKKENVFKRWQPPIVPIEGDDTVPLYPTVKDACNEEYITPYCVKVLYGIFGYQVMEAPKNHMAVANFNGEATNRGDLEIFLEEWQKDAARSGVAFDFKTEYVKDQVDDQDQQKGGSLTAQIAMGLAWPVPFLEYRVGGYPTNESQALRDHYPNLYDPFLLWLHTMLSEPNPPQVVAITHGWDEQDASPAYSHSVCNGFAKLGARGITVVVNSGDNALDGSNPKNQCDDKPKKFVPRFPASCPYVTTVGATRGIEPDKTSVAYRWYYYIWPSNNIHALIPWVSGAGFSNYFPRPKWQEDTVQKYLWASGTMNKYPGRWNKNGRAYPDVSAHGFLDSVMVTGWDDLYDGTAISTATMAAIIALVNDALLAVGKPALGFMNPWLYMTGFQGFTDVKKGSVQGCGTVELDPATRKVDEDNEGPIGGFPAVRGWDLGSGFGTPWFPKLKELALEYQHPAPTGTNGSDYPPYGPP